jgi:hypothetical protein
MSNPGHVAIALFWGDRMGHFIALLLCVMLGVVVILTILAWQTDYEMHDRLTWANCAMTLALLTGALGVLLFFAYLMAPSGE